MMKRCNDALAGMMKDGGAETPEGVAAVILEALTSDAQRLRYQSSHAASVMAARKIVDVTGQPILQATRTLIG